jgi:2-polyprenyl-6-hydroxyphenyl methylase/3-demethylubiquinone-9 3-methyltransferase
MKFADLASDWWNPNKNPLISMNPTRISFITKSLLSECKIKDDERKLEPLHGLKILDVGCGGGLLSESLARLGAKVTAIDPSIRIVKAAQEHSLLQGDHRTQSINYLGGMSIESMANEFESHANELKYDAICILEVIEHTSDPKSLMQCAASLLKKPNGTLFISTLNRTLKSYILAIIGAEYITRTLPVGTHSWDKFRTPQEVEQMAKWCGLRQTSLRGMVLEPSLFHFNWRIDEHDLDANWIAAYKHQLSP